MCIAAAVFYAATTVLCCYIPVDHATDSGSADKQQKGIADDASSSSKRLQNKDETDEGAIIAQNNNMQKVDDDDDDVVCGLSPQMNNVSYKKDEDEDVERIVSFETSVTEPTISSPSRGREASISLDFDDKAESVPVDSPYDEALDVKHTSNDPCELTINAAILKELAQMRKEDTISGSDNSKGSIHNDLVYDLM